MSVLGRFAGVVEATPELRQVRSLQNDEQVFQVGERELGDLVQVAGKVHGPGQRNEDMFRKRLLAGEKAYALRKGDVAVCCAWLAAGDCEVYDLRMKLRLPPGSGYFFDLGTVPGYRGAGMLGKTLGYAWRQSSLEMAVCCVRSDNLASLSATQRLGFRPIFTAALTRVGLLRVHTICDLRTGTVRRTFSGASLRPNSRQLMCWIGSVGLEKTEML